MQRHYTSYDRYKSESYIQWVTLVKLTDMYQRGNPRDKKKVSKVGMCNNIVLTHQERQKYQINSSPDEDGTQRWNIPWNARVLTSPT
jgi:hypothetical protein